MTKPTYHVLLVEDDIDFAKLATQMLVHSGISQLVPVVFSPTAAPDLAAAINHMQQKTFDAVLLDLSLPDSEGIDTLRRIQELDPDCPILVMTGLDDTQTAINAIREGAADYIVKSDIPTGRLLARHLIYARQRYDLTASCDLYMRELENSETRFHNVLSNTYIGIAVVDKEGVVRFVNTAVEQITHRDAGDLIGTTFDVPVKPGSLGTREYLHPSGIVSIAEIHATPSVWEGEPAFVLSFVDITERRQREERLAQLQLNATVDAISKQLLQAIEKHVNAISDSLSSSCRTDADPLHQSTIHAEALLRQITAFTENTPPKHKPTPLTTVFSNIQPAIKCLAIDEGVTLKHHGDDRVVVNADSNQLEQVIIFLVRSVLASPPPDANHVDIEIGMFDRMPNHYPVIHITARIGTPATPFETYAPSIESSPVPDVCGWLVHRALLTHGGTLEWTTDAEGTAWRATLPCVDAPTSDA